MIDHNCFITVFPYLMIGLAAGTAAGFVAFYRLGKMIGLSK